MKNNLIYICDPTVSASIPSVQRVVYSVNVANTTGGDNSKKGCFGRKAKFFRESGNFAGNRQTREIFWERRKYSGTLQEKTGTWNTIFILLGK